MLRDLGERVMHAGLNPRRQIERLEQHLHAHVSPDIATHQRVDARRTFAVIGGIVHALRIADRKHMPQRDLRVFVLISITRRISAPSTARRPLPSILLYFLKYLIASVVMTSSVRMLSVICLSTGSSEHSPIARYNVAVPVSTTQRATISSARVFSKSSTEQVFEYSSKKLRKAVSQSEWGLHISDIGLQGPAVLGSLPVPTRC